MSLPRITIVSPFIDKRHGTERNVAECIERLASEYEIHVYSNRVEDVDLNRITWHRIPALPGPHLFAFLWWFAANHLWRWSGRWVRGGAPEVVFSPGINCLDADAIFVHVVFARFRERMKEHLLFRENPWTSWLLVAHRRLYYRLIIGLERRIYTRAEVKLLAVSGKTAADLEYFYHPANDVRIAHNGLDLTRFNPEKRADLREEARRALGLSSSQFVLLLIGNDWKSKGLPWLFKAAAELGSPHLCILVAGRDNPAPFEDAIQQYRLSGRVHFLPPRPDVEFYYAAADAYVSPSLDDAFALPPAEAMACGLPIITSRNNGGSEVVSSGEDGFVLEDPSDFRALANILYRLMSDHELSARISAAAVRTAKKLTWGATAAQVRQTWEEVKSLKGGHPSSGMVIGLFTEILSAGGVQRAGRHTAAVVANLAAERSLACCFLSLNDPQGSHTVHVGQGEFPISGFARGKTQFVSAALRAAGRRPKLVIALHPHLAPVVAAMRLRSSKSNSMIFAHGIEVWRPLGWLRGSALRRADMVVAPSADTVRHLVSTQGIRPENVRTLAWGLDPEFEARLRAHNRPPRPSIFPERTRIILTVGRWESAERYKGADTLIAAMPQVMKSAPDSTLVLVGDGDDLPRLQQLAHQLGVADHVRFVRGPSQEELFACYAHCDVFALPSGGEGFGLVFLEAMAHGKPVIGGAQGGIPDVIEDGATGLLVPAGEVEPLRLALESLLLNRERALEMGARGCERVQTSFTFCQFQCRLKQAMEEVLLRKH